MLHGRRPKADQVDIFLPKQMGNKKQDRIEAWELGKAWRQESPLWFWEVGNVDVDGEHIELRYGNAFKMTWNDWIPVARLGKRVDITFPVQWLLDKRVRRNVRMINEAVRELNFYLIELFKPDPWEYAIYHCQTASNIYSRIHWTYFPEGISGNRVTSQIVKLSKQEFDEIFGDDDGKTND